MNEIKLKIQDEAYRESERHKMWAIENVAPFPTIKQKDAEVQRLRDKASSSVFYDPYSSNLATAMEDKADRQAKKSREQLRTDIGTYSSIKINKISDSGERIKYTEVKLINADKYQKLSDPKKWSVLVLNTGSGRDRHALGIMVSKGNIGETKLSGNQIQGDS